MKTLTLLIALVLFATATQVTAQTGTDSCTTPDAIAGQGLFPFDQTGATTGIEGQNESLCYNFTNSIVDSDVWFAWTADATGTAFIQTCNQTSVDTKIAAYPGNGCPSDGDALNCNDDSCGLQSLISFACTSGTVYTLQVGTFQGAAAGLGALDINIASPIASDNCSSPTVISGQGAFAFDNSLATTGAEGQTENLCYAFGATGVTNDLWITWTPTATGAATVATCNLGGDTKLAAYPGSGCPTAGTALDCNDDSCALRSQINFAVTAGTTYTLQVGNFPGASGGPGQLDLYVDGPPQAGTAYCFCPLNSSPCGNPGSNGSGCGNSSGIQGGSLVGNGNTEVGDDTLVLSGSGLAPNQPGLFFQGSNRVNGGAGLFFGDGLRCAGGGIVRLGVALADGQGKSNSIGLALPISVKGGVAPGDLRHYQLWYRDPQNSPCGALFNLTNGYSIQW